MRKRILNNKKGFTLVELIATVALMAIIATIAVPSIYSVTSRRQRSTAEYDSQTMYRNAIACITALAEQYKTPETPTGRGSSSAVDVENDDGWYVDYERQLVRQLYNTIVALDLKIVYYDSSVPDVNNNRLAVPPIREAIGEELESSIEKCSYLARATYITAGNKNPYVMIQIIKVKGANYTQNANDYQNYMILSYHNDARPFTAPEVATLDAETGAFQTNGENDIVYKYRIRKV